MLDCLNASTYFFRASCSFYPEGQRLADQLLVGPFTGASPPIAGRSLAIASNFVAASVSEIVRLLGVLLLLGIIGQLALAGTWDTAGSKSPTARSCRETSFRHTSRPPCRPNRGRRSSPCVLEVLHHGVEIGHQLWHRVIFDRRRLPAFVVAPLIDGHDLKMLGQLGHFCPATCTKSRESRARARPMALGPP